MSYLVHIKFKFKMHSTYSGYDCLTNHTRVDKVFDLDKYDRSISWLWKVPFVRRLNRMIVERGFKTFLEDIHRHMQDHPGVYHFLYPENTLAYFDKPIPANCTIVASFHQPESFYAELRNTEAGRRQLANLSKTDVSIALSKRQQGFLENMFPGTPSYFLPHGVDTEFFSAGSSPRKPRQVLLVGNWLRDFECARAVADAIATKDPSVQFIVVSNAGNKHFFENAANVDFRSGIPNEELRALYRESQLLFLPLKGAVANNAVLEASACGLPVMITQHAEMEDYSAEDNLFHFNLGLHCEPENIAIQLLSILNNREELNRRSLIQRKIAERFGWNALGADLTRIYDQSTTGSTSVASPASAGLLPHPAPQA